MPARKLDGLANWRVDVPKNHVLFDEGDDADSLYLIESGCMRLQINGEDGSRRIVAFLFAGDIFGVGLDHRRIATAEAVTATRLRRYPATSVRDLVSRSPDTAEALVMAAFNEINELSHRLCVMTQASAEPRLMWFLQWLSRRQGGAATVTLPMSRRDIADFLALAPETLSRTFASLEDEGLISVEARSCIRLLRGSKKRVAANGLDQHRSLQVA